MTITSSLHCMSNRQKLPNSLQTVTFVDWPFPCSIWQINERLWPESCVYQPWTKALRKAFIKVIWTSFISQKNLDLSQKKKVRDKVERPVGVIKIQGEWLWGTQTRYWRQYEPSLSQTTSGRAEVWRDKILLYTVCGTQLKGKIHNQNQKFSTRFLLCWRICIWAVRQRHILSSNMLCFTSMTLVFNAISSISHTTLKSLLSHTGLRGVARVGVFLFCSLVWAERLGIGRGWNDNKALWGCS